MNLILLFLLTTFSVFAAQDFGYLKPEDQKYFKNDSFEGNNKMERIDANVKEINKLHADMAKLKAEVELLKAEMAKLQNKK